MGGRNLPGVALAQLLPHSWVAVLCIGNAVPGFAVTCYFKHVPVLSSKEYTLRQFKLISTELMVKCCILDSV